jgi:hypothetical protein
MRCGQHRPISPASGRSPTHREVGSYFRLSPIGALTDEQRRRKQRKGDFIRLRYRFIG